MFHCLTSSHCEPSSTSVVLITMRALSSNDKHESKPTTPAVPDSQITHFENSELLFLLGGVKKPQCCRCYCFKASRPSLLSCGLNMFSAVHCCFSLYSQTVSRLSAFWEERNRFLFCLGLNHMLLIKSLFIPLCFQLPCSVYQIRFQCCLYTPHLKQLYL